MARPHPVIDLTSDDENEHLDSGGTGLPRRPHPAGIQPVMRPIHARKQKSQPKEVISISSDEDDEAPLEIQNPNAIEQTADDQNDVEMNSAEPESSFTKSLQGLGTIAIESSSGSETSKEVTSGGELPNATSTLASRPKSRLLKSIAPTAEWQRASGNQDESPTLTTEGESRDLRTRKKRSALPGRTELSSSVSASAPASAPRLGNASTVGANGGGFTSGPAPVATMIPLSEGPSIQVNDEILGDADDEEYCGGMTFAAVDKTVKRYIREMRDDHEHSMEILLERQRRCFEPGAGSTPHDGNGTKTPAQTQHPFGRHRNPFKDMKPINLPTSMVTGDKKEFLRLEVEHFEDTARYRKEKSSISAPVITPRDDHSLIGVPRYRWHIRLRRNVLAANNNELLFIPFYTDDDHTQEATDNLKDKFVVRHGGRFDRNVSRDRSDRFLEYIEAMLEEFECRWSDVLRYFLHSNAMSCLQDPPRDVIQVINSRKDYAPKDLYEKNQVVSSLVEILDDLQESSEKALSTAALVCAAFHLSVGFSLFEIVQRLPIAQKKSVEQANEQNSLENPPNESKFQFRDLACQVCQLHDCPYHGLFVSDESASDEDSSDDVRPSNNNQKQRYVAVEKHAPEAPRIPAQITLKNAHDITGSNRVVPCDHEGSCEEADCSCFAAKKRCEKTCGCAQNCKRRFRGCSCARSKRTCHSKDTCPCRNLNKECDPDLCGPCGVREILDPANKYNEDILRTGCGNCQIQRGVPKRMLLGTSEIHGFGLFMGEPAQANDFLGEYVGELISTNESERRTAYNQARDTEYMFVLNLDQEVDGTYAGNKTRFINNSSRPETMNCYALIKLCGTVARIGMFALREIGVGEELFFDYRYTAEQKKNFVEKAAFNTSSNNPKQLVPVKSSGRTKAGSSGRAVMYDREDSEIPLDTAMIIDHDSDEDYRANARQTKSRQRRPYKTRASERRRGKDKGNTVEALMKDVAPIKARARKTGHSMAIPEAPVEDEDGTESSEEDTEGSSTPKRPVRQPPSRGTARGRNARARGRGGRAAPRTVKAARKAALYPEDADMYDFPGSEASEYGQSESDSSSEEDDDDSEGPVARRKNPRGRKRVRNSSE